MKRELCIRVEIVREIKQYLKTEKQRERQRRCGIHVKCIRTKTHLRWTERET
jgi:hypothetical protein